MGSWNKTCGLSNLHIYAGEEVYAFVIKENVQFDRCYATAMWHPVMIPFVCKYNDYGAGDTCSLELTYILDALKHDLVEVEEGPNPYHDIAVNRDNFDEELFFNAIANGRLWVRGYLSENAKNARIDCVFFRKDIVDQVLSEFTLTKYEGESSITLTSVWSEYTVHDVVSKIPEYIAARKVKISDALKEDPVFGKYRLGDRAEKCDVGHNSIDYVLSQARSLRHYLSHDISEVIDGLIDTNKDDEAAQLLTSICIGFFVEQFMESTRRHWAPACFEGSQSSNDTEHRILCNAIIGALNREREEMEDWPG